MISMYQPTNAGFLLANQLGWHPCNAAITPLHFQAHKFNKLIEIDYIFKKKVRKHGQVVYKQVKIWESQWLTG